MILDGGFWERVIETALAIILIVAFLAFIGYRKDGKWFWEKRK